MDCPVINERVLALRGTASPPPELPITMASQTRSMDYPLTKRRWSKLRATSESAPVVVTSGAASSQENGTSVTSPEGNVVHPAANEIPRSPPHRLVDVLHYKYIQQDQHIGELYMDFGGQVAFYSFSCNAWIPWHGEWLVVNHRRGFKIEFDPDPTDEGPRANTWTFVYIRTRESMSEPRYGIDSNGRSISMEKRCEWIRLPDQSYERVDNDVNLNYV